MADREKKLTSLVWRAMAESAVMCLLLVVAVLYILHTYGYIRFSLTVPWMYFHGFLLFLLCTIVGAGYGYWQGSRLRNRLEVLGDSMLLLEKGNLGREVPVLGDDEVGQLRYGLERIRKRWEEQITSLQRLSTNNAELAEKARFSAITEERQRLARELHDAVSQQLFAISMTATALARTLEKDIQQSRRKVTLIEEMSSVAQSEMRALLLHLRPVHLEGKLLSQGLSELMRELQAKVPVDIVLDIEEGIRLSRGVEDHLFRIVQEAMSNTLRHSKATSTEIRLHQRLDTIRLSIRDNGVGFELDQQRHTSYGLLSMEERVNEIGGTLQIMTAPGKGTRIEIRVPIVEEEENDETNQSTVGR